MTSINQARLKAIGQSYIKPTGWYSAHSLAEHATVNSFELWIKVSVGDDRLISDLATISATIRHITSVSVVQVLTSDHWSLSAIERVILSTKKKEQHEFVAKTYFALEKLERKISHVHQSIQSQTQHDSSDAGSSIGSHEEIYPEIRECLQL